MAAAFHPWRGPACGGVLVQQLDFTAEFAPRQSLARTGVNKPALFTKAGENWRQFPDFPLLATEELDYPPRHLRHPWVKRRRRSLSAGCFDSSLATTGNSRV